MLALLGPSGCGKTTLLRTIAGLERPDHGSIIIGDRVVSDDSRWIAPEKRRVGMVFQDWALFPHLTVGRNVGYGLDRAERNGATVEAALAMVELTGLADRMPSTLSGGQQQRVALARALAPRPSVLLLDEPFSNLDTTLRVEVRTEVHRLLVELGITTVFVTHDQEEAFVLGDRVALMHDGRVEQIDRPADIYDHPTSRWVAQFVGTAVFVAAEVEGSMADTAFGPVPLDHDASGSVDVLVRPEHLELIDGDVGVVELIEYYGHDIMVIVRLDDDTALPVRTGPSERFGRGDRVGVRHRGTPTTCFARA